MATEGEYCSITVVAANDFRVAGMLHKVVTQAGQVCNVGSTALGLAKSQPMSGHHLNVGYAGHMKAYAGAAITAGARLMATTSGYIITAVSGSSPVIGRALEAAASGDLFSGVYNFAAGGTAN